MAMQGLLDDGDEMLIPMPDYPLWTAAVNLSGGTAIHYKCDEENSWYPDIADIESKITRILAVLSSLTRTTLRVQYIHATFLNRL